MAQTSLLKCAVDISPRKKLMHTMPPNTDRPINRAMVVGCAISATRNHLKLHEPRRLKSTLLQHSRQNAKVVEAFCHAACRLSNQCRPSIHQPPVDEFRMPAEMSIALSRAHLHARMHVASCWHRVHHRDRHQHTIPIALAALPGTSRDFVPWRFSDAGRRSAWIASSCRRPKTYTGPDAGAARFWRTFRPTASWIGRSRSRRSWVEGSEINWM